MKCQIQGGGTLQCSQKKLIRVRNRFEMKKVDHVGYFASVSLKKKKISAFLFVFGWNEWHSGAVGVTAQLQPYISVVNSR